MEKKSSIISIGLTIHNTPVDVREKLAIPEVFLVTCSYMLPDVPAWQHRHSIILTVLILDC